MRFAAIWVTSLMSICTLGATRAGFGAATVVRQDKPDKPATRTTQEIAQASRGAIAFIRCADREGDERGNGSGFVIRGDGVIATNFHVIGDGRPFTIQFADGKSHTPTHILAVDRDRDLAIVKVDATNLAVLPLGDSDELKPGQPVLSVGNPLGLRFSVTDGVVAERRTFEGRPFIQVAMPIEPGNSGGPLIDREGRAVGVIAIKSLGSVGFAVPINDLKTMLNHLQPVPMARWLTIGALPRNDWTVHMGGQWRQRAGRIVASGAGSGFGGRTLCVAMAAPPKGAFEVQVQVKLDNESGAAGLAFHADGGDRHYGFYPTAGSLRLTRFEGPDVTSWTILQTIASEHYRPGEWNTIKVRVDGPKLTCFVNDEPVIEANDEGLAGGRVGLVKFRDPGAEFRHFHVATTLPATRPTAAVRGEIVNLAGQLSPRKAPDPALIESLSQRGGAGVEVLRDRARELEQEAQRLRVVAALVHQRRIEHRLAELFRAPDDQVDLIRAALVLAQLDNEELEIEHYIRLADQMAADVRARLDDNPSDAAKLDALVRFLYDEYGFHGSRLEYYHRSNSYLNEVLDDREGIPITLSLVFIELSRRIGLPAVGIGLPGHFVVQVKPGDGPPQLIDAFQGGKPLSRGDAALLIGRPVTDDDLVPATKRQIIVRMLRNLVGVAQREQNVLSLARYADAILVLDDAAADVRWMRAMIRSQTGQTAGAIEDLDVLIATEPRGINASQVQELRDLLRRDNQRE